jgi:asparagine synthase (glutamine-hydrolysing)
VLGGNVNAALGHARLAIVDLSSDAAEPMQNENGLLWLTFNGEIYNHRVLRQPLEAQGHRFVSQCDAEVLLHGYEEHGASFFRKLDGMYAFALLDVQRQTLVLCRDPYGIKPLYFFQKGGTLAFASELRALHDGGFSGAPVPASLGVFLGLGYVPHPYALLDGVKKVNPGFTLTAAVEPSRSRGSILTAGPGMTLAIQDVRHPPPIPGHRSHRGYSVDTVQEVQSAIWGSVSAHLMADVEVGTFLSGGVDSALITAAMVDLHGPRVQAFTIAIDDAALDESAEAAQTARALGIQHHVRRVSAADAIARLPALLGELDEPLADPSILPTRLCAELAREHVKVVLSGDGGDEFFAGYTRHKLFALLQYAGPLLPMVASAVHGMVRAVDEKTMDRVYSRLAPHVGLPPLQHPGRKLRAAGQSLFEPRVLQYARMFRAGQTEELGLLGLEDASAAHLIASAESAGADALTLAQTVDLRSWLPGDILTKLDRATMAVGLEARVPLICDAVARAASALPVPALQRGGLGKRVLRDIAQHRFGKAMSRRPKRGFGIPLQAWLAGPLAHWRRQCVQSFAARGMVAEERLNRLEQEHHAGKDHAPLLFAVCALETWWQRLES